MGWDEWHKFYDDRPPFQARLAEVRAQVSAFLDAAPPGPVRILSICSGDGRDVVPVIASHERCPDVVAHFVDLNAGALERGRDAANDLGLCGQVEFVEADAGLASSFAAVVPVDLFVVSGVLGHLSHDDAERLFRRLPAICKSGGSVIWSRNLHEYFGRKQVESLRELLVALGFEELAHVETMPNEFVVARARFVGVGQPLIPDERLFRFIGIHKLMECDTPLGCFRLRDQTWVAKIGRPRWRRAGLEVPGDAQGPDPTLLEIANDYLGSLSGNLRRLLGGRLAPWRYRLLGISVGGDGGVHLRLKSRIPPFGTKVVVDQACRRDTSASENRA